MLLEKRKKRLLIEWSQVRVLLGEPDLCFGRIRLLLRTRRRLRAVNHQCRTKVALTRRPSIDLILVIRPATVWYLGRLRATRKAANTGFQVATGIKPSMGGQTWPSSYSEMRVRAWFRAAAR